MPFLQNFASVPLLAYTRFGKWNEILTTPSPNAEIKHLKLIWHYARGIAFVRKNNAKEAQEELDAIQEMMNDPDLENLYFNLQETDNNTAIADSKQRAHVQAIVDNAIYTMPITSTYATGTSFVYSGSGSGTGSGIFGPAVVTGNNATKQLAFQKTSDLITPGGRSFKMSFDANDQYLLGGRSCGAFLFLSPINLNTLKVEGDTKQSRKQIKGKVATLDNSNALSVDIIFQYRMTDYFGNDPDSDTGRVGGQAKLRFPNLTYTKKIGLDIFDKHDQQFSFDLEVFAKYTAKGKNLNSIRAAKLTRYGA